MTHKKLSVCLVTCYRTPGYVRVKSLEAGLLVNNVDLSIVRNERRGYLRYIEVIFKLIKVRLTVNPGIYILTFRGYEMLPFVRIITIGKTLIFDEFINLIEWVVYEQKKIKPSGIVFNLLNTGYRFWLKSVDVILTDTASHAQYSSELMNIPINKYTSLVVSTDEDTFMPLKSKKTTGTFKIFYYGSMLPLHGVGVVIDAMNLLLDKDIRLILIGGNKHTQNIIESAIKTGSKIDYRKWVNFEELPSYIQESDVCLAGPFGGTVQAQFVITGKAYQFLRMKKPIIVGENKESHIFTDKKDAFVVKQANAEELAKAVEWAYRNRSILPDIGRAGYQLYQHKLSNKVLTRQMKELLIRL